MLNQEMNSPVLFQTDQLSAIAAQFRSNIPSLTGLVGYHGSIFPGKSQSVDKLERLDQIPGQIEQDICHLDLLKPPGKDNQSSWSNQLVDCKQIFSSGCFDHLAETTTHRLGLIPLNQSQSDFFSKLAADLGVELICPIDDCQQQLIVSVLPVLYDELSTSQLDTRAPILLDGPKLSSNQMAKIKFQINQSDLNNLKITPYLEQIFTHGHGHGQRKEIPYGKRLPARD